MNSDRWLDAYSGQTTDELLALQREYRADSLVLAFEQALDQKSDRVGREGLTQEELVVLAVEALEREVNNGGYAQFLANASCEYAPIVVDALNRVGCTEVAMLTQRAIDALGLPRPVTVQAVEGAMADESDTRDEALEECDERYYAVAEDLAGPLLAFIERCRDRISLH